MATFTEISVYTRKLVVWIGIGLVAFLFLRFIFILAVNYYKATHPIQAPPPNVLFDKIPAPKFPTSSASSAGMNFVLENIEGKPPETTPSARVYFMPKKLPSLLAPKKARDLANKLGFTTEPQLLSSTLYRFSDPFDSNRSLELDIINQNFQLSYDFQKDPTIFTSGTSLNVQSAISDVQSFIPFDGSILSGPTKTTLLQYAGKELILATSLSDAQAIRVDYFRKDSDGLVFLPPQFDKSFNYALLSGSADQKKRFLKIAYTFWPIAYDNFATYPLRRSQDAWNQLVAGQGIVATMGSNEKSDQIVIRKIYLAYYDNEEEENYMQPIFVFEGDGGFAAYVPAIDPSWFQ